MRDLFPGGRTDKTMRWTRAIPVLTLALFLVAALIAQAQQVSGRVIDRNGSPQGGCIVEFYVNTNQPPVYRVSTNNQGVFYVGNPRNGTYSVRVQQGQRQYWANNVSINGPVLNPSTLVVNW